MENVFCECYRDHVEAEEKKQKKQNTPVTVVLKVDMHCDGCIARIVRLARRLEGVETVRPEPVLNKLTLIGFMEDPVKTAEKLQKKSKKKVELISPKPKKETKEKDEKKSNDNKTQTVVAVTTVVLKLNCSCDGCIKRIYKTIRNTKGVYQVKMDKEKETVTVMGAMDVKNVTEDVKRKLKKTVHVVPEKKKKEKDNAEGITKVGSPFLPCYGCTHGFGPYRFPEGPMTGFFSEEDQSFCSVM
ncbi:PREDICTED: heavy metal-associated isoprenylated plant protein 3-like [Camelina sativa]|uniref:Heavy metal-associated isoprenylated plant protein 3-like n=1 Tax=Camelina sativa TaxID=90675 RepID=A0ABM0WF20_CAMSA|nr:PREDICTED: heavy metal-associated isoprenylated plant protein 3-like [Camelina sativa]